MAESIPRYTSTAEGFRDAKELAALRPVRENTPRSRKPRVLREVTSGIVCFCGERFGEAEALEFMLHLRAEVGEVLAWREHVLGSRRIANMTPAEIEQQRARKRAENMTPEQLERKNALKRAAAQRRRSDPEYRERENARHRDCRARKKAAREAAAQ